MKLGEALGDAPVDREAVGEAVSDEVPVTVTLLLAVPVEVTVLDGDMLLVLEGVPLTVPV